MQQQVGFADLVEGRFERFDQLMGQLADKSDRIRKQKRQVVQYHLANRRIERGKKFVFGENLAFRD